jgi:iron complex outermembrane receptor protein
MVGELAPGWRLIAAYAYTDAEIRKDADLTSGNELQGIPEHSGSIWSTYEFQGGTLKGFGLGAGLRYVGTRQGDNANSFEVPDYTQLDATVFYKRGPAVVRLSGYNLTDEEILLNPTRSGFFAVGAPASVLASLNLSY